MLKYFIDCNRRHATMVDRTIAQHAGRTLRRVSQDLSFGSKRPSRQWISWTKDHDRRTPQRGADMRWTRIIGDDQVHGSEHRNHLVESRLARKHGRLMSHSSSHLLRYVELV